MDARLEALRGAFDPSAPLAIGGGCLLADPTPSSSWLIELRSELRHLSGFAQPQDVSTDAADEVRGGTPPRRMLTVGGGSALNAFYADEALHETLSRLCGVRVVPRGPEGSYSFYSRPGDFLGVHRDMDHCDVALISVLEDTAGPEEGGSLVVYRQRYGDTVSMIKTRPYEGAEVVHARPGQSILLAGGLVPHCVTPMVSGQLRIVSTLCFRVAPA